MAQPSTDPGHWGPIFDYLALTRQATVASAASPAAAA
ncbi:hypothetical protein BJ999_005251 [Actinomadura citrea]|uniref:Uncharacterized protein n=1 Tax=Actinomadura citrea TaxID=46158 RepID=A0A7Y9GEE7_9ACTN|nr:hypothetical protein [Actinomadura citrea]